MTVDTAVRALLLTVAVWATSLWYELEDRRQGTPVQRAVKVARDSILCSSSASLRQQRACRRLDSIIVTPIAPAPAPTDGSCPGSLGNWCFTSRALYNAPTPFPVPPGDTVSLCAFLERHDGKRFVGVPVLRMRALGDSAAFATRGGNTLLSMCGAAFTRAGVPLPADSIKVTWSGYWMPYPGKPRGVWRPIAAVLQP